MDPVRTANASVAPPPVRSRPRGRGPTPSQRRFERLLNRYGWYQIPSGLVVVPWGFR